MSILCGRDTRLLIQGLGRAGRFHAGQIIAYGTEVVGGVHPRRAGETEQFSGETDHSGVQGREDSFSVDLPIFSGVAEAVDATGANASLIFVSRQIVIAEGRRKNSFAQRIFIESIGKTDFYGRGQLSRCQ